ncbi:hypothetical protein Q3G72_005864 [Acer saccharum]|nr:hypothetical protein Q3G72_005864 [Acer saccharum]
MNLTWIMARATMYSMATMCNQTRFLSGLTVQLAELNSSRSVKRPSPLPEIPRNLTMAAMNKLISAELASRQAIETLNLVPLNGKPIRIAYSRPYHKSEAGNIIIKNLDKAIDNEALLDAFTTFGNILSCKVATDLSGQSKGYGFVLFDNEQSATSAIEKLNGTPLKGKKVYVGPYLRKHKRYSSSRSKLLHVTRREILQAQISQMLGRMSQYPRMLPRGRSRNIPFMDTGALELSALANATPENQRKLLGEHLYPLVVDQLEHDNAAKITCLLLEILDPTDVLHLMESPESLKAIVLKAMELLRFVAQQQHASLLVNDNIVS